MALGLIALAQFMVIMDTSIIGVAPPRIQADLGFTQDHARICSISAVWLVAMCAAMVFASVLLGIAACHQTAAEPAEDSPWMSERRIHHA